MEIKEIISKMTLEEKASMCSGADFWHTQGIERLDIPAMMVSDGPFGLRKQDENGDNLGVNDSIKAVCFPASCAMAASFDTELMEKVGEALGNCCQAEDVSLLLGPALNIKRSPLCGRNFEYYSEDPYLAGKITAAFVRGVQSQGIGACLKHFAANNQEHRRMEVDSIISQRALREIYLSAFEMAVKESKPWSVMCSYNRINGVFSSENKWLLKDVLRKEWGFDGYVISDWGAVSDRVKGVEAGLDLEMPPHGTFNDELVAEAVRGKRLKEADLDSLCESILSVAKRYKESRKPEAVWDKEKDHSLAEEAAVQSAVLLTNNGILPLKQEGKIAFIGEFADKPRYQGGGSSHINSFKTVSVLEAVREKQINAEIVYERGYDIGDDEPREDLIASAIKSAAECDTAVIFAGLSDKIESEGYDRRNMKMPKAQLKLIDEVIKVQPNTVIVLHNGSPVEMPFAKTSAAILEMYLAGQAVGAATVRLLFGMDNPSGHLAETFPIKLSDNPSYLFYPGRGDVSVYGEDIFVGYRYYDKKEMEVLFPFGHGLSYTSFEYSDIKLEKNSFAEDKDKALTVSVKVKNTGKIPGAAVVQLYVRPEDKLLVHRSVRELKGFKKVYINPNETRELSFELDCRSFSYYEEKINDWFIESGKYVLEIGESSRDIRLSAELEVLGNKKLPVDITLDTPIADLLSIKEAREILKPFTDAYYEDCNQGGESSRESITSEMIDAIFVDTPIRGVVGTAGITLKELLEALEKVREAVGKY